MENNRLVVLGANGQDGFLATVMALEQGHGVLAISRRADLRLSNLAREYPQLKLKVQNDYMRELTTLEKDLREFEPDHVLYLVSSQGPSGSSISTYDNNWTSIEFPRKLIDWAKQAKFGLTLPLSSRMYSGHLEGRRGAVDIGLSWPTKPNDAYGSAKARLLEMSSKARDEGVFVHSPVLFNHDSIFKKNGFVGSAAADAIASFFSPNYENRISNPLALLDITDAVSVVRALLRMMGSVNDVTMFSSGRAKSVREIALGEIEFLKQTLDLESAYPQPLDLWTGEASPCLISSDTDSEYKFESSEAPYRWLSLMVFSRLAQNRMLPSMSLPLVLKGNLPKTFWGTEPLDLQGLTPA